MEKNKCKMMHAQKMGVLRENLRASSLKRVQMLKAKISTGE
jgi:hypothetical protein